MTFTEQIRETFKVHPGMTSRDLAEQLGCSRGHVTNIKCGRDMKPRKGYVYFSVKLRVRVAYLWGMDWGVPEIANECRLPLRKVISFLEEEGFLKDA